MRRQPSPPIQRVRSPSPPRLHRQYSPSPGRRSYTPPRTQPHSYIAKDIRRDRHREYDSWNDQRAPERIYNYGHRSRSPINRDSRQTGRPPYSGNMRGYRSRSRERFDRLSPQFGYSNLSLPPEQWSMDPAPEFENGRAMRNTYISRTPSPIRYF